MTKPSPQEKKNSHGVESAERVTNTRGLGAAGTPRGRGAARIGERGIVMSDELMMNCLGVAA